MDTLEFDTISSTHLWAKEHLPELKPNPILCITAREQTNGIGRRGRSWVSPKDQNLYATFVFNLPKNSPSPHNLAQILSLSCVATLESIGLFPKVKWPNDILLNGKKCAGVICNILGQAVIISIGLNINMLEPLAIDQPNTSIFIETGKMQSIDLLKNSIASNFEKDLNAWFSKGFKFFYSTYNQHLANLGFSVTYHRDGCAITGILRGITVDGHVELETPKDGVLILDSVD